jgi:hypothetical protein
MDLPERLPSSILGGDPFNHFRFLYRRDLLWKLHDEEYCLAVMRAAYQAGGRAFDLSFKVNARLFARLAAESDEPLVGFGNPTWEQGILLNGRYLQYSRDRILCTCVDRAWPRPIARLVAERLAEQDVLVFGYDRDAAPLSDKEIAAIRLDRDLFLKRLNILHDCRYILFGGSDADWLISLGRTDIVVEMAQVVRAQGLVPILLCQYPTLVVPAAIAAGVDAAAYAVPLNKGWSWFDRDECVAVVKSAGKPVIAFMPLASPGLAQNIPAALDWLFGEVGVDSILFGTATAAHARQTTILARERRAAADAMRTALVPAGTTC